MTKGVPFQTEARMIAGMAVSTFPRKAIPLSMTPMVLRNWLMRPNSASYIHLHVKEATTEGTTQGNFDEYITLQNPGNAQANVTITYYRASGGSIPISHVVSPHARATVTVFDATELSRPSDHSTLVNSDQPIIAERPMYFVYDPANLGWDGGHCVMGYGR